MNIKISACTITKNEEKNIARSIESYKDYVDEIIIVDTGSTDDTVKIAESLGAKVIHFTWINDFSAAKNCALNAANGEWILFLDADEWIKDNGGAKLQTIAKNAIANGYDCVSFRMLNLDDNGVVGETTSSLRFFANKPNIRYVRKIHEHLLDFNTQTPLKSIKSDDLVLNHCGYAESISKTKVKRNKELLEKNYLSGESNGVDYFYLARENVYDNPEYSKQFLDNLFNDKDKLGMLKKIDISNNIHDLNMKLIKILSKKFSFSEKLNIIDDAIKAFPDDPFYYYNKHVTLSQMGYYDGLELINKALELDKTYESKVGGNNNVFSRYKVDALYKLAQDAFRKNDNLKAMDYLVQAIQTGQLKEEPLKGLMYIIEDQDTNEKITFLNSIFNTEKEEVLKLIVQTLRLSKHADIFLYYFVKYYKLFGEVDISLFTSMLINQKFAEVSEKYLKIFVGGNDNRAEKLVVASILAGELKEFYENNKVYFSVTARKILNAYFEGLPLEEITKEDEEFIINVVPEILYIASEEILEKIKITFKYNENLLRCILRTYYLNRNYKEIIKQANTFIENDLSDEFAGEVMSQLGEAFYMMGEFLSAQLYFEQAIEVGFLDVNVARVYEKLIEKIQVDPSNLEKFDRYKYLIDKFIKARATMISEKIDDIDSSNFTENVEEFCLVVSDEINLTETFKKELFKYANKLLNMNNLYLAEEYYKILIRCKYNLGKCYYNLGKIYNKLGAVKLSYFCYENAFKTSIDFPTSILEKEHKNYYYLYNPKVEEINEVCPICGNHGKLKNCYQYLEDNDLTNKNSLIVKYASCEACSHIFAVNYTKNEIYSDTIENKKEYIFNANDIKDKLDEGKKLVVIDETGLMAKAFNEDFDTTYVKGSIEKTIDIKKLLKTLDKNRTLIMVINNINNVINEDLEMPLWAKPGIINAYSKKSVKKLLEDNGYKNIKIYDSKFLEGKMTIVASV